MQEPPEEYTEIDCSRLERELQELAQGPDESWRRDHAPPACAQGPWPPAAAMDAAARQQLDRMQQVTESEEGKRIRGAPPRLA